MQNVPDLNLPGGYKAIVKNIMEALDTLWIYIHIYTRRIVLAINTFERLPYI